MVVDTLRFDALAAAEGEGAPGPTSMPFLAELASKGVSFRHAASCSPWTLPALGSLVTGLLPPRHGAIDVRQGPSMPSAVVTFAETLAEHGYETAAFVDTPWFGGKPALAQGFTHFQDPFSLAFERPLLDPWLRTRGKKPFFLLVHTGDAHDPYGARNHPWPRAQPYPADLAPEDHDEPWEEARAFFLDGRARETVTRDPSSFARIAAYTTTGFARERRPGLVEEMRAEYYAGARWVDAGLRTLVDHLQARGALENTLLVVTSDHGEAFGEHGLLGHGRALHDELIRIPLVMHGPGPFSGGREIDESVGLVDVMPTFLDLAGIAPAAGIDGRSFLPVVRGEEPGRAVLSFELVTPEGTGGTDTALLASARSNLWKYVVSCRPVAGIHEELYDLVLDPLAGTNLLEGGVRPAGIAPDFCSAVEQARDVLWERLRALRVSVPRPRACGTP